MNPIDVYLEDYHGAQRALMDELRSLIQSLAPEATETISYGIPTFKLNGNLVHFGAGKNHVGVYPGADGVALVADELDTLGLVHRKGTIQLPLDQPLPTESITRIVAFRLAQQRAKAR